MGIKRTPIRYTLRLPFLLIPSLRSILLIIGNRSDDSIQKRELLGVPH